LSLLSPVLLPMLLTPVDIFFVFFGVLECVGHTFAHVAHLIFLRDVWIKTLRAAVASRRSTDLATHDPSPYSATRLPV
jgi:hypothetical protein